VLARDRRAALGDAVRARAAQAADAGMFGVFLDACPDQASS
jgi:hypothetical protein